MNRTRFDENIVMGIVGGGIVSVLSAAFETDIHKELSGIGVMVFAVIYAGVMRMSRKKRMSMEQTWEENRESVVRFFLSAVDDDVIAMTHIFEKLELKGFDFNKESGEIDSSYFEDIDYNMFEGRFDKLPLLQNILGFITYEQHLAVYNYLKYSKMFIDCIYDEQKYKRNLLILREEQAKKMLELFNDEVESHS